MTIRGLFLCLASLWLLSAISAGSCSAEETAVSAEKPRLLDQFTNAQLNHLLEGIKAAGAYGPSGLSGSLRSVADAVNVFPYAHQNIQPSDLPATHSVAELRLGLLSLRNSISALEISLHKTVHYVQPEEKTKIRQLCYAFLGLRQYLEDADVLPDGSLTNHNVYVFDGEETRRLTKTNQTADRVKRRGRYLPQEVLMYLKTVPVFAGPDAATHEPEIDFAALLFDYEALCQVLPSLETVDGAPCHVVVCPLGFLFWIEAKGDHCNLRRMVEFRIEGNQNALVLNRLLVYQDFRPVSVGQEWPYKSRETYFADVRPDGTRYQDDSLFSDRYLTREYTVTDLKSNDSITAGRFQLSFPPGTLVTDTINERYYRTPTDPKDLPEAIADGSPILADGTIPDWYRVRFGEPPGYLEQYFHSKWIFCLCVVVILLLAWVVCSYLSPTQGKDA